MKNTAEEAAEIIKQGGVILYPTDTIWGLGCDPNNADAIAKVDKIKKRMAGKTYLLIVNSERMLNYHVAKIPEVCYDLIDFATKPMTIIYPKGKQVHTSLLAEDGSLGIRMTSKPNYLNALLNKLKHGIVSTSANLSGKPFPANYNQITESIKNEVDFIVDPSFENTNIQPSQIIKIGADNEVKIIRS